MRYTKIEDDEQEDEEIKIDVLVKDIFDFIKAALIVIIGLPTIVFWCIVSEVFLMNCILLNMLVKMNLTKCTQTN